MPNFTEKAIKDAFWKLLSEQPLNQISVRAIAEECGINRNSFYYHFQDIPSLIEQIITETADALIEKYPSISSVEQAVEVALKFTLDNKKAVLHICNSVNRNIYEQYLMKICEYVVVTYCDTVFEKDKDKINENDREILIQFTKCEVFGLFIDWINKGMDEGAIEKLKRLLYLCHGLSGEILERCKNETD